MKTRVGFAKSDLSGEGARRPRDALGARTVIGRAPAEDEPYRPGPPDAAVPPPAPVVGAEATAAPSPPAHTGKSGFPAHAGFWGRRDDDGELVPLTDPGAFAGGWRGLFTPLRRAQLRRIARSFFIITAAAALGFTAVYLVVELRTGRRPAAPPPVPAAATPAPPPAPAPALPKRTPPTARPAQAGRPPAPARSQLRKRTPPRSSPRDEEVLRPTL